MLKVIDNETARDRAANDVAAMFAQACFEATVQTARMSGFVVVTFDEFGKPTCSYHTGDYFPIPPTTLPKIVKQCTRAKVYTA